MASTEPYTLYYNKWSICSQMVLLTLAFRGQPKDAESEMIVEEKEVDIFKGVQLQEAFLTEINPKGQVSVLLYLWTRKLIHENAHLGPSVNEPYCIAQANSR